MFRPDLVAMRQHITGPIVTRFAPAPTGYLHLGHVVNAIYVWGVAAALGGTVILRVEDHDRVRSRPEYERALIEDLTWLGLLDYLPPATMVRQRERGALYDAALARLRARGLVYACDCTRATYAGERYPGHCRHRGLAEGPGRGLRVRIEPGLEHADDALRGRLAQSPESQCGDLLVKDRNGHWTYQFAVTVDDLQQAITLVIRGEDLVLSTGRQVRLGRLLLDAGLTETAWPPLYLHHPLLYDEGGVKLSKSTGATGVRELRNAEIPPAVVLGRAAAAAGLLPAPSEIDAVALASLFTGQSTI